MHTRQALYNQAIVHIPPVNIHPIFHISLSVKWEEQPGVMELLQVHGNGCNVLLFFPSPGTGAQIRPDSLPPSSGKN